MTGRVTDGIRRLCGIVEGMRDNEFAEATVRKAAVAEACDRLDEAVGADRDLAREEGRAEGRREAEAELAPRLMPEGMEWPTVDGRRVDFKTPYQPSLGVLEAVSIYNNGAVEVMSHDGIIKPVSEIHVVVLAADGRPLREGEHVYHVETGAELVVKGLPKPGEYQAVVVFALPTGPASHLTSFDPDRLTHERPVMDADGVPIREGDTVWHIKTGREYVVVEPSYGETVVVRLAKYDDAEGEQYAPDQLTHTKPEPKRICGDCRHWQGDPSASHMGVCYRERWPE